MTREMISANQNFHTSVNIDFDLYDDEKIKTFVPTISACQLIEKLFMSVAPGSSNRAKVLVGAYGRGKSHIVLVTLALLSRKQPKLFSGFLKSIRKPLPGFEVYLNEYLHDDRRLLPVVITGNTPDLAQSFLQALFVSLRQNNLERLMPTTNVEAAISAIETWRDDYPQTLLKFEDYIGHSYEHHIDALRAYDLNAYRSFLELYPKLTSGGVFNSLSGLDVVDVYCTVSTELKKHGYNGVYVVYDEFSKYLETNISEATINDVKLLQDFAEKCNRSNDTQMHLLLICHKDISNYIDGKLPKERVDGWRGVSGRFEHIEIRNGFGQSYELIASTITKDKALWSSFERKNSKLLAQLEATAIATNLISEDNSRAVVRGCYPLHPTSTFLLPRISEKVAQNERTLFTYLTTGERSSLLNDYLQAQGSSLGFITPDKLYDFFEPLFRKEAYTSETHSLFSLTSRILVRLDRESLESKIVKTIMLIYAIAQFEHLAPTKEAIINIYSVLDASADEVNRAVENLIKKDAVVYLRKSNGYLKLKESSGVDIEEEIKRYIERSKSKTIVADVLNELFSGKSVYPSRHNDDNEIVRYFRCTFISSNAYWSIKKRDSLETTGEAGNLYAIMPSDIEDLERIRGSVKEVSKAHPQSVFIIPNRFNDISEVTIRYKACNELKQDSKEDILLADEYDVFLDDYSEVIGDYYSSYFQPELKKSTYYQDGKEKKIRRKAQLSSLLSSICDRAFPKTPIINNEAICKDELSAAAVHSRTKILAGLCAPVLEPNLGLQGNGQECSIMRSVFSVTKIIESIDQIPTINTNPKDKNIAYTFETIRQFVYSDQSSKTLKDLYYELCTPSKGIGLKKGLVILFLTIILRQEWSNVLIKKGEHEQRFTVGVLNDIDCNPEQYRIELIDWSPEKDAFVDDVLELFADYAVDRAGRRDAAQAIDAMTRWYLALPRYTKTATKIYKGEFDPENYDSVPIEYIHMLRALKQPDNNPRELLFYDLPAIFDRKAAGVDLLGDIKNAKEFFDSFINTASDRIADDLRFFFDPKSHPDATLSSAIFEWREGLSDSLSEHVFSGTTNRILSSLTSFTSDEDISLKRLFKAVTSLRIEDWDERTVGVFIKELQDTMQAINDFENCSDTRLASGAIRLSYFVDDGKEKTRTFVPVPCSPRARLLKNEIESALYEMGQSIDDAEKRQVLFDVLKEMC